MYDPSLMVQQGPNPGERFAQAFQQGTQNRDQNMAKAAMAALVRDPNNQKALEALASVDPASAQQFQQQKLEMVKQQLGQHYDSVLRGAQLIRQMQPKDDASWQQVLTTAQQAGIDVSEVPPHFDPQYVQSVVSLADAFAPQQQHNPQIVPVAPGGGVATINPQTRGLEFLALPNGGDHPAGAPVNGPLTDEQMRRMMNGGQAATPPATFP